MLGEQVDVARVAAAVPQRAVVTGSLPGARPMPVDAPREGRLEQRELLGDHERRVVGQHHAAGADPDAAGAAATMRDQHRRVGRRDRRHVVVLGDPVAAVAELVGSPRQGDGGGQGLAGGLVAAHRDQVEDGQGQNLRSHPTDEQPARPRRYSGAVSERADHATPVSTVWNPNACHAARSRRSPETATMSDPVRNSADAQCTASYARSEYTADSCDARRMIGSEVPMTSILAQISSRSARAAACSGASIRSCRSA